MSDESNSHWIYTLEEHKIEIKLNQIEQFVNFK